MPGKGMIFNKSNTDKVDTSVDLSQYEGKEYHVGYLLKKGQHLFAGFSKRWFVLTFGELAWYSSEQAWDAGEAKLGHIKTEAIVEIMSATSHPGEVDKAHLNLEVDTGKKKTEIRELRHDDPDTGWQFVRDWFKALAAESSDRRAKIPESNLTWKRLANQQTAARIKEERAAAEAQAAWDKALESADQAAKGAADTKQIQVREQTENEKIAALAAEVLQKNAQRAQEALALKDRLETEAAAEGEGQQQAAAGEFQQDAPMSPHRSSELQCSTVEESPVEAALAPRASGEQGLAEVEINEVKPPETKRGSCARSCAHCAIC